MICSSSLADDFRPLVFDTSVLINLYASSYGERILASLSNAIIVPQVVVGELEHETSRKNGERKFLHGLLARGRATSSNMTDREKMLFADLVSGSRSLGDGEAATIAIAANRQLVPILDDGKAQAIAIHTLSGQEPSWSLDLFRHSSVTTALGESTAIDALFLALRDGRMRIPVESTDYTIGLLGIERARKCTCLPNYGKLFGQSVHESTRKMQEELHQS